MAKRPAPLIRWLVIAALLMLVIGIPLIFWRGWHGFELWRVQ